MMASEKRTIIGIPSCRNPEGLTKLLRALEEQTVRPAAIIVVDNDTEQAAVRVVRELASSTDMPIEVHWEPVPGIPYARNRIVATALEQSFEYLVMIDDDEFPSRRWLEELVRTAETSEADVVGGPVKSVFQTAVVHPAVQADFDKTGGRVFGGRCLVESTANVLLRRSVFLSRIAGGWFDTQFAQSGSSDCAFLRGTAKAGARHAIAPGALVYEDIPPDRAMPSWLLKRSFRNANGLARIRLMDESLPKAFVHETLNAIALLAKATLLIARGDSRHRFEAAMAIARVRGKVAAMTGVASQEYSRANYR